MAQPNQPAALAAAYFLSAAGRYWLGVYPYARTEIHQCRRLARTIASPHLRVLALQNLELERINLEGAAAFATFSHRRYRRQAIRAQVAFQAAYDFVDTLAEQPSRYPLQNARRLHTALLTAVGLEAPHPTYYAYHDEADDNGYLAALIDTARAALVELPSYRRADLAIKRCTSRIGQYQTLISDHARLAAWARQEAVSDGSLAWWETAAAAGSSMAVFALIAAAARLQLGTDEVAAIERAYFPWIGALHTLLDSLIDHADDRAAGRVSLIDYYPAAELAANRLVQLCDQAKWQARALPRGVDHLLILAGMMSAYLSSAQAAWPPARLARTRLVRAMGGLAWPTLAVFYVQRLARRIKRRRFMLPPLGMSATVKRPG